MVTYYLLYFLHGHNSAFQRFSLQNDQELYFVNDDS